MKCFSYLIVKTKKNRFCQHLILLKKRKEVFKSFEIINSFIIWLWLSIWTETNSLGVGSFIGAIFRINWDSFTFIFWEGPKGIFCFGTFLLSCCSEKCRLRWALAREDSYTYFKGLVEKIKKIINGEWKDGKRRWNRGKSPNQEGTIISIK